MFQRIEDRCLSRSGDIKNDNTQRHKSLRARASTLTVSLPMIKLEIPVENEEDIMNMSLTREDVEQFLPHPMSEPFPDLILSATGQSRSRTSSGPPPPHISSPNQSHLQISSTCSLDISQNTEHQNDDIMLDRNEISPPRCNLQVSKSDPAEKVDIEKRRDSLKRSRQLHSTVSENGHIPLRRKRHLERENEIAESSLEEMLCLSSSNETDVTTDSVSRDIAASAASFPFSIPEPNVSSNPLEDSGENTVEMQFLRTLQNEINRAAQSPRRMRDIDKRCNEDETWC